ncbi:MAG: ROK family protein [Rikenellaceae bacterium]|nr:ROK family protein [Rikenellaceae bacterium]
MTSYANDRRAVMTLDAGGTNFVFSAIKGCAQAVAPLTVPSNGHNLDLCLKGIVDGFRYVERSLGESPAAISFAFPGPSYYRDGVIGDLGNLPAFRGGVALGPMLSDMFGVPVYINNDGDLYAYGEATAGILPWLNGRLEAAASPRRFRNLVGITLGTGFGAGIVCDGKLHTGDNGIAAEVWNMSNRYFPDTNMEELVSIRAVRRFYADIMGMDVDKAPTPKEIYGYGLEEEGPRRDAALEAYRIMGRSLGDALANIMTATDSVVVIGGGVAGARALFMPAALDEVRSQFASSGVARLCQSVYDLDNEAELNEFLKGDVRVAKVPFSDKTVRYDAALRLGVGFSRIGTSRAISIGAYAVALDNLDR